MNHKFITLLTIAFLSLVFRAAGQQASSNNSSLKTYSAGARLVHLLDLPSYRFDTELSHDMKGLNGDKTRFDLGFDMYGEKQFTPMLGVQLGFRYAQMTGSNELEYYENRFSEGYLDVLFVLSNLDFFHKDSRWNFYAKAGLGYGNFSAEQFLVKDDVSDGKVSDNFWEGHLGAGIQYELTSSLRLELESNYNMAYTDAFDGYNYGSGSDSYLTTAVGVAYTFGPKDAKPMYATNYFGESYIPVAAASQAALEETPATPNEEVEALKAQLAEQQSILQKNQQKLNQQERELHALKEGLKAPKGDLSVYFDFDSSELSREAKVKLMEKLKGYPQAYLELVAFADNNGSSAYNQRLKQGRAESVKRFLIEVLGFEEENINISLADGEERSPEDQFLDRKVMIRF